MPKKNKHRRERAGHRSSKVYEKNAKGVAKMCRNKTTYDSYGDAIAGAVAASRLIGACRIYKCPHCNGYHLTTQVEDFVFECRGA